MVVHYFGGACFRLQSGDTSLLIDAESGRLKADIYLRTLTPTETLISSRTGDVEISFPGEYEVKGIEIKGILVSEETTATQVKTAYCVNWEDIRIAFLGHISKNPSAAFVEALNEPDILFLPAGGGSYLAPEAAARIAKLLEPSLIFPSLYKSPADFLKAMGQKAAPEEKFTFKKKDLASEKNRVIILRQN